MRRWIWLLLVLVAAPLIVVAAPAVETGIQRSEVWANMGTAFGGFATGGGALLAAFYMYRRQRKKDAAERDERIKKEKAERQERWDQLKNENAERVDEAKKELSARLDQHALVHNEIKNALADCASREDVHQVTRSLRDLTGSFNHFLQTQITLSQAETAAADTD